MTENNLASLLEEIKEDYYTEYVEKAVDISTTIEKPTKDVLYDLEQYLADTKEYNYVLFIELMIALHQSDIVDEHAKGDLVVLEDYKALKKRIRNNSTMFYENIYDAEVSE